MPYAQALEIIEGARGRQFDPDILDAFVVGFDEFCTIADRYADTAESIANKLALVGGRG
jgi:putative two-component system response regulator